MAEPHARPSFARRVAAAKPREKKYDLWDDAISGLGVCVYTSPPSDDERSFASCRLSWGRDCPSAGTAHGHQEHDRLSGRVRGEEVGYFVVEERKPAGAAPEGVGREVDLAAQNPAFELGRPVPPIPVSVDHGMEVGQVVDVDAGVRRYFLPQSKRSGFIPEVSLAQQLQGPVRRPVGIGPGRETLDRVDNQVDVESGAPGGTRKSAGMPPMVRSTIIESWANEMLLRANRRVDPRRRMTASTGSAKAPASSGYRGKSLPEGAGCRLRSSPPRHVAASGPLPRKEAP